mgnify:CR=1 FL=1|tara:strand:- start:507 stop:1898 length:1392 start_codon:yes stop_codon:yes gene_type:complete
MNEQMRTLLSHFYGYAKEKLGFDKDASIQFVADENNSKNPLGMTANYNPDSMQVTVYTTNRHPKDVLRSVAHELVHHKQNCQGKMNDTGPTTPGYAQNDLHLRQLEEEAYLEGNMCFRDWEDTYKANQEVGTIYESVIKTYTKEKLKMSTKEEMRNIVREAVSRVLTQNKVQEDYEEDPYMDELENEFPFLKDEPKMGGAAPADVQAAMDDEMPSEEEDEMMEGMCPTCGMSPCGCPMEEEVVAEGDEMSRTITQIEKIGDEISRVAGMVTDVAAIERLEMIDGMVTGLLAQMQGVDEASTEKHDDDPALKGDQDELPDNLQKAIIDAEEEKNEAIEDEIQSDTDRYGDMKHIIPGVRFTGDIETDVRAMEENEELADWLYGELGSGDVITDSEGKVEYAGHDVQDWIGTGNIELPDIAETQEDFYTQMRNDARTLSEDWNREIRNKRSSLLNERLMKAWKLG